MTRIQIPANSLLSTQFSQFEIKASRKQPDRYKLIASGKELNTVWFSDRPIRDYGHFDFDTITGKSAWNELFSADNPNSVLTGGGKSLVFETGYFRQRPSGKYVSRIKFLNDQSSQDIITGQLRGYSLLIDPTGTDDNGTGVKVVVGLLTIGAGALMYNKYRADMLKKANQQNASNLLSRLDAAKQGLSDAVKAEDAAKEALDLANESDAVKAVNSALETVEQLQAQFAQAEIEANTLSSQYTKLLEDYAYKYDAFFRDVESLRGERARDAIKIMDFKKEARPKLDAFNKLRNDLFKARQQAESLRESLPVEQREAFSNWANASQKLREAQQTYDAVQQEVRYNSIFQRKLDAELDKPLGEFDVQRNLSQASDAIGDNLDDGELDKVFNENLVADNKAYAEELSSLTEDEFLGVSNQASQSFARIVSSDLSQALSSAAQASHTLVTPGATIDSGLEFNSPDSMARVYSEYFETEQSQIFKETNLIASFESDLAQTSSASRVQSFVSYAQSSEFKEATGELVASLQDGAASTEAIGSIDLISEGLGGQLAADSLVSEAGGEYLIGEIAVDVLEEAGYVIAFA